METPSQIRHGKETHSFYILVGIISFGILVLQPLAMVLLLVAQTVMGQ